MLLNRIFYLPLRNTSKCLSFIDKFSTSSTYKEEKIKIKNYEINYLRVGQGPHHVFFAAAALGTAWSDYRKQIEGFDHNKFSMVLWDPPGLGKSIALDNKEASDMFYAKADFAYEFMKAVQIPRYSALGWSYGGIVCLMLASRCPDVVNKVVAWGSSTFFTTEEIEYLKNMRNLNTWSKSTLQAISLNKSFLAVQFIHIVRREGFIKRLEKFIESRVKFYDSKKTTCDEVMRVKCPTFLLHSAKDHVTDSRHMDILKGLITNARTHLYPEGGHNIHVQHADDFNRRVQEFLLQPNENDN